MARTRDWQASDDIARTQLNLFHDLSDRISLTPDDRRRALDLTDGEWRAWHDFLVGGPMPVRPSLPDMLWRLGRVAFNLTLVGEAGRAGDTLVSSGNGGSPATFYRENPRTCRGGV